MFATLRPQSLAPYLSVLHCTLEDRLYQTKQTPAEKQQSLLDGMKNGQRIAIDVGYQEKMTDFVLENWCL